MSVAGISHMAKMYDWPVRDRPRERMKEKGARALSDAELLALVIGTGAGKVNAVELARGLLQRLGGVDRLARQGLGSLLEVDGLGEAKATRILAAVELGARIQERRLNASAKKRFTCSADIWSTYRTRLAPLLQEVFLVVGLNNKNEPLREEVVAMGSVDECRVGPREVFRPMLMEAAARVVVLHNHPSGDCTPSPDDVALTLRLEEVGELLGIPLLDHLVVGGDSYSSLRDLGLMGGTRAAVRAVRSGAG